MTERLTNQLKAEHTKRIADYYDVANIFYYVMWHRRTFGLHYGIWSEGVKNHFQAITKENEFLADLAGVMPGDRVLDAGCGVGGSSAWLAKNRSAEVVGINLSDVQLGGAKRAVSEKKFGFQVAEMTDFAKADYHTLPFKDNSFDIVWSLESIEHAASVSQFVEEATRVLNPGGSLVIAATLSGDTKPNQEQQRQLQVGIDTSGAFKDSKTANEVAQLMNQSGLENIQIMDLTDKVLKSAEDITRMCKWGYPVAKLLNKLIPQYVPKTIVMNNEWGLYQEGLFRSGVTRYNVLIGYKPR